MFYLRKTPMDQRIEEIMRQYECSKYDAYLIYQNDLEKNRNSFVNAMNNSTISPLRNISNRPDSRSMERD
jgi:chemotaxis methyl-accepting protein methylase